MKKLFLALILISLSFTINAQDDYPTCEELAVQASDLLRSAQDLLADGNIVEGSTLIDSAIALLDSCNGESVMASPVSNATLAPTSEANVSDSFTITAPVINEEASIAFIRFAHTSVDVGAIDFYMNNGNVLLVSNLVYGDVTEFLPINGGEQSFLTRRHNAGADSEVLYQLSWNFVGNSSWIVSALGLVETFAFTLEPISVLRNEYDEQARIRVVNLMAGAPRVSVTSDSGLVLADGLGWIGIQDSLIPAGSYSLQVSNDAGADESLSFDFEANFTYTLYVVGQETLEVLNIVSQADMTNVRFVNNSHSAVDIHYRPGNARLVENLANGGESEWISILSGAYTFISYAPNTGPTGQELAGIAIQLRPQRYMVFELVGAELRLVSESLGESND